MYIRRFDPWKNELCSCPTKYSLNPYTGCAHGCIYCYASCYIKDFFRCREKPRIIESLRKDIKKVPIGSLISLCNTSDPYPPMEKEKIITRRCLEIFKEYEMKVLIITKSDLVCRDIDLLKDMQTAVTITITTLKYHEKLEPYAPNPFNRLKALEKLNKEGIPTGLRLDPIIPMVNEEEIEEILQLASYTGVKHVTTSTFKPRWDSWKRLISVFPNLSNKLENLYLIKGQRIGNSYYLNSTLRENMISKIKEICISLSLSFSTCRENLPNYINSKSCDGSHLIEGEV
ncbi:MAG: radical SAM protein [Thermodesulfovibrio sp.]|nr:radical SAM protein [Thermodesulfovibrio sp.]